MRTHPHTVVPTRHPARAALVLALVTALPAWAAAAMPAERIIAMGLPELRAALDSGALTSADLVAAYLQRIESIDRPAGGTRAVLAVNGAVLEQARAWDAQQRARQGAAARNASLAGVNRRARRVQP